MTARITRRIGRLYRELIHSVVKFGVVGLICYGIDVGIFNILRLGVLGTDDFLQGPIGAKVVSATIATLASWCGNRLWTFRQHRRQNALAELVEFCVVAVVGMSISLLCLYVSHFVLGFDSLLADNISSNVVGLVLGTAFRFLSYRFWVYSPRRGTAV
ncbi:MAG TPA: GtrA family protein [Lacisediminihabitans sp.]|nr:GtrA family protein [Lacisediminihabitans sp.]HXD61859.1 GtrA family protein [Lacisediminihabitans sp.]